jgi:ribosomal protein L37AE/L43A
VLKCPLCGGRDVGRIAPDHYYCWNCFVELATEAGQVRAFHVDLEGMLTPVGAEGVAPRPQPGEGLA